MKTKTCVKCGNEVNDANHFCEKCGGSEFRKKAEIVKRQNPSIIHKVFYWNYDGQYMLSKSKIAAIVTFLVWFIPNVSTSFLGMLVIALIFAMVVFLVGYVIRNFRPRPPQAKLDHNDYGIATDLKHLFFYWQNAGTGEYVLSKTKIISAIFFVLFALLISTLPITSAFASVVVAFIFDIPAFAIGAAVHKFTNPNPINPKREISKPKEIPKAKPASESVPDVEGVVEFIPYKNRIMQLSREYSQKEKHTRELIEKRFAPPQLTYTKFIGVVDKSTKLFNTEADSAMTMINLASEGSPKIENEIKSKIDILESIIDKMDDLTNELVLTMDKSSDEEVGNLFDDMSNLIRSVSDYD